MSDEQPYQFPPLGPPDPWWFTMMVQHLAEQSRRDFRYRMPTGGMPRMAPDDLRIGWFNGA